MQYRVKDGHTAFVDNALREAGYIHQVEKPYKRTPAWAEEVKGKPKKSHHKRQEPAKTEGPGLDDLVGLGNDDGKTVQL